MTVTLLVMLTAASAAGQIVLVKPQTTAKFVSPGNPDNLMDSWSATLLTLLRESGINAVVENETFLTSNAPRSTIILHHAECLSDEQIKALHEHLNEGNGLWITSATGYRDETGSVRGWDFLQNLAGGTIDSAGFPIGTAISLQLRYGMPGSSNVPPGYRLRMALTEKPLFIRAEDQGDVVGYWARDKYIAEPPDSILRQAGFVCRTTLTGARVAWMGSGVEGLHLDPVNREMCLKVMTELIDWLEGKGIPSIEVWPDGRKCAVLIHGDLEDKLDAIGTLTSVFKRQDVPVTYNILTSEAVKFPRAIEEILKTRAELSNHGDNLQDFYGQPYQSQIDRLKSAGGYISLYGPAPTTFRPPELVYDDNTLRAAKSAGITAFLTYDKPDRDYPIYSTAERSIESALVFFPKSELADYDLFEKLPVKPVTEKSRSFIGDFHRISDVNGLYKLNFHSRYLMHEELPKAVETAILEIKSHDDVWIADARTISQWIRMRSRLLLQAASDNARIHLTLTNTSSATARDVVLRILPPQNVPAELLVPRNVSENCQYDVREGVLYVNIPPLKPGTIFKMELGAGDGHALSLVNKNILLTGFKAFIALAGIFVLWFIMYLSFSGKKIRRKKIAIENAPKNSPDDTLYGKLSLKQTNADLHAPANLSSRFSLKGLTNSIIANSPARAASLYFPVIPDPAHLNFAPSSESLIPSRTVPMVEAPLAGSPSRSPLEASGTRTARSSSTSAIVRHVRVSSIPSLPMVLKPLTATERKPLNVSSLRKNHALSSAPKASAGPAAPKTEPAPTFTARTAPKERLLENPGPLSSGGKRPSPLLSKPPENRGSSTFQSPGGLRTTAKLPKLKNILAADSTQTAGLRPNSPSFEPPPPETKRLVRTSADIIRKKQAIASNPEEWR